ncbi:MAG: hypothetical protein ACMUHU_06840, partial [Thermoplasmatota archaeon]
PFSSFVSIKDERDFLFFHTSKKIDIGFGIGNIPSFIMPDGMVSSLIDVLTKRYQLKIKK